MRRLWHDAATQRRFFPRLDCLELRTDFIRRLAHSFTLSDAELDFDRPRYPNRRYLSFRSPVFHPRLCLEIMDWNLLCVLTRSVTVLWSTPRRLIFSRSHLRDEHAEKICIRFTGTEILDGIIGQLLDSRTRRFDAVKTSES